uniref:Uncharacterized protein n=1 Tax=Tolypothrix bouteillei VB521301 TaxID=1479485 RepID=A0A0C1RJA1_9CYAN
MVQKMLLHSVYKFTIYSEAVKDDCENINCSSDQLGVELHSLIKVQILDNMNFLLLEEKNQNFD